MRKLFGVVVLVVTIAVVTALPVAAVAPPYRFIHGDFNAAVQAYQGFIMKPSSIYVPPSSTGVFVYTAQMRENPDSSTDRMVAAGLRFVADTGTWEMCVWSRPHGGSATRNCTQIDITYYDDYFFKLQYYTSTSEWKAFIAARKGGAWVKTLSISNVDGPGNGYWLPHTTLALWSNVNSPYGPMDFLTNVNDVSAYDLVYGIWYTPQLTWVYLCERTTSGWGYGWDIVNTGDGNQYDDYQVSGYQQVLSDCSY